MNNKRKIKSAFYIVIALFLNMIISSLIYYYVDLKVAKYIMATVEGTRDDWIQAYTLWYLSYDWILLSVEFIIKILIAVILFKFLLKFSLKDIGRMFPRESFSQFFIGLLFGAISITMVFLILVFTDNALVSTWQPAFSLGLVQYLIVFILVGFSEELLFRGFVIKNLKVFKNKFFIAVFSGLIFSLAHSLNGEFGMIPFLNIMLIGILFAYVYMESKSLWMPIGFHILWNYFQGNIYGFPVSGITFPGIWTTQFRDYNIINGGGFGPEGGLVTTFVILLGLLFVKWYLKNRRSSSVELPLDQ